MTPPAVVAGRVLVDELVRCGVGEACLAPGSRSAPIALALHADPRIRLHVRFDERSAGFLALGLAKATGRPAAVVCTSGTAAANLHPAVLEADQAHVPLLVLTADRPPELRGTGANQTVDQLHLYGRAVRWFHELGVPEDRPGGNAEWRSVVSRAWAEAIGALGRPPGPVHLDVPFRDPLVTTAGDPTTAGDAAAGPHPTTAPTAGAWGAAEGRPAGAPWTAALPGTRAPADRDVATLAALVARAERGLVVVGDTDADVDPLLALAEAAAWPVLAEPSSGARRGPMALGAYRALLADPGWAAAARPSVVLVAGRVGLSRQVQRLLSSGVPQVVLDPHGGWSDPGRQADRLIAGDPGLLATAVLAGVDRREPGPWPARWRAGDTAARAAIDAVLDASDEPSEPRTARDLAAMVPDGSLLMAGSSMPIRDLDLAQWPREGLRVVANRGASGIDGLVSTAIGAALGHGGPSFALLGDLTLLHDQNGLLVAGQPEPDLVVVVLANDGGAIFSFLEQAAAPGFERVFGTPHGVALADVARAAGRGHQRVHRAGELGDVVARARAAGGIQLVEVRTDRHANVRLHARLQEAVSRALPPPPPGA